MDTSEMAAPGRPAHEVLAWGRSMVDPALRLATDSLPAPIRRITGYHLGWWDEHGHPLESHGGKAIRPALTLLGATAIGGMATTAVPAAVAIELVHNFSVLHDDVMDRDTIRRHRPTAWRVFGVPAAVLTGDALLTLAFDVLATSGHPSAPEGMRMLSAAALGLLDGQSADLAFDQRDHIDLSECLAMARGKTGVLLGCACALGGLFGNAAPERLPHLRAFGEQLGVAFQLVDDLLGIWGDPGITGKPVFSDLYNRKRTLPVVAAMTSGTQAGHELAQLYRREGPLTGAGVEQAAELIEIAGGRTWSIAAAEESLTRAMAELRLAEPTEQTAQELDALARLVTSRDH
jgi:geranylgeranyl diphosphate synthase type I